MNKNIQHTKVYAKNIHRARKEKGITQKELMKRLGANSNIVSSWETSKFKPTPDYVDKLVEILDLTKEQLTDTTNIIPTSSPKLNFDSLDDNIINTFLEFHKIEHGSRLEELIHLFSQLSDKDQFEIIELAKIKIVANKFPKV